MDRHDGALLARGRDELDAGASLEPVEPRVIDPTPLDEERRSALWLYAWNYETRRRKPGFARRSSLRR